MCCVFFTLVSTCDDVISHRKPKWNSVPVMRQGLNDYFALESGKITFRVWFYLESWQGPIVFQNNINEGWTICVLTNARKCLLFFWFAEWLHYEQMSGKIVHPKPNWCKMRPWLRWCESVSLCFVD